MYVCMYVCMYVFTYLLILKIEVTGGIVLHIVLCSPVYNHLFRRKIKQEKYILGGSNQ